MKKYVLLIFFCAFFLSGCVSRELEEELLVIVLTVDLTENGGTTVSVKVPGNPGANQQADSSGQDQYLMLESTGPNFSSAMAMLNATTPRRLNFSQVREIVIGENAAVQPDFAVLLRQIDMLPRFRCSAAVIISRGQATDFAKAQRPYVGIRLSRYAENTLSTYAEKGFIPSTDLCRGIRDLGYGFQDPLFILGAVNDFSEATASGQQNPLQATAGSLPRKSAEAVELFGAAATDGVSVSGYLTGYEMAWIQLLSGRTKTVSMTDPRGTPLQISLFKPAQMEVDLHCEPIQCSVQAYVDVLYPSGFPPDEESVRSRIVDDIQATLRHMQSLRCDGIGFGSKAVRRFDTAQEWEAFSWREKYIRADIDVRAQVRFIEN